MKRLYIGILVLLLLLAAGLLTAFFTSRIYAPITSLLDEAVEKATDGDFATAVRQAEKAKNLWDACKNATATVADHTPMEEIDHLFAEMEIYARMEEIPHFAACCAQLSAMVNNMGDAHKLNLWNLL